MKMEIQHSKIYRIQGEEFRMVVYSDTDLPQEIRKSQDFPGGPVVKTS